MNVFELVSKDAEKVILKVNAADPLTVAMNPYVASNYAYITVTRGKNHILTVVHTDGTTFSFHWGESGHTLISDSLQVLKKKVVNFIENECHILLEYTEQPITGAKIFYNTYYGAWQLTIECGNDSAMYWDHNARNLNEMIETTKLFNLVGEWKPAQARTGIDLWRLVI